MFTYDYQTKEFFLELQKAFIESTKLDIYLSFIDTAYEVINEYGYGKPIAKLIDPDNEYSGTILPAYESLSNMLIKDSNSDVALEGIIESLKKVAEKAIEFIKKIVSGIINFFKNIFSWLFGSGSSSSSSKEKKIEKTLKEIEEKTSSSKDPEEIKKTIIEYLKQGDNDILTAEIIDLKKLEVVQFITNIPKALDAFNNLIKILDTDFSKFDKMSKQEYEQYFAKFKEALKKQLKECLKYVLGEEPPDEAVNIYFKEDGIKQSDFDMKELEKEMIHEIDKNKKTIKLTIDELEKLSAKDIIKKLKEFYGHVKANHEEIKKLLKNCEDIIKKAEQIKKEAVTKLNRMSESLKKVSEKTRSYVFKLYKTQIDIVTKNISFLLKSVSDMTNIFFKLISKNLNNIEKTVIKINNCLNKVTE